MAPIRSLVPILLVVAAVLAGCTEEPGQGAGGVSVGDVDLGQGSAGILGAVVDVEMQPIEGALVVVPGASPIVTDAAGGFLVRGLAPGEYELEARADGYSSVRQAVSLAEG